MKKNIFTGVVLLVCLLFVLYPVVNQRIYTAKSDKIETVIEIRVTWKERVSYGEFFQQHYYLIYGELADGTPCVLQNSDSPQRSKYNGSDLYQQIDIGYIYTFFATGERNPRYARYPNIIEILNKSDDWSEKADNSKRGKVE
jgi:hypothetical protein